MRSLNEIITYNNYWYEKEMSGRKKSLKGSLPVPLPIKQEYQKLFSLTALDIEKLNTALEELESILSFESNTVLQDLYYLIEDIVNKSLS